MEKRKGVGSTILSKIMSELAKESHRKSPRPKEFYQNMANKRWGKDACSKQENMVKSKKEINK